MALDRNLIIRATGYNQLELNDKNFFLGRENSLTLDTVISDVNKCFDINDETDFCVDIAIRTVSLKRFVLKSIPVNVFGSSIQFNLPISSQMTADQGYIDIQFTITDDDTCKIELGRVRIPIKSNVFDTLDEGDEFIIDHNDVINDLTEDGNYDQDDTLGAKQAQELLQRVNQLETYINETIKPLVPIVGGMKDVIDEITGNAGDDVIKLRTYKYLKVRVGRNGALTIIESSNQGCSIRVVNGSEAEVTFPNDIDSAFVQSVTPYSRLFFSIKSVGARTLNFKCYNCEKVVEKIPNPVTGIEEDVVTWDAGNVNFHQLPVGMEIHIVYLS